MKEFICDTRSRGNFLYGKKQPVFNVLYRLCDFFGAKDRRTKKCFILIFSVFSLTTYAYSNAGLPMIAIVMPGMIISLIPIIFIESYFLFRNLKKDFKISLKISAIANTFSTLIGIPITWAILVLLQLVTGGSRGYGLETQLNRLLAVTWQSPWLYPYEQEFYWMVPSAISFLLIPFFFSSWFIEYQISKRMLRDIESTLVKKSILLANLVSYIVLWFLLFLLVLQ